MHLADPISPLFKSPFKLLKATWKMMQGVCSQQCWPASKQRTNCAQLKKSIQPKNSFELECQELVWLSNFPSNKSGLEDWVKVKIFVFSKTYLKFVLWLVCIIAENWDSQFSNLPRFFKQLLWNWIVPLVGIDKPYMFYIIKVWLKELNTIWLKSLYEIGESQTLARKLLQIVWNLF